MSLKRPSLDQLADVADRYALHLTEDDLESFQGLMDGMLASYARLDQLTVPTLPVTYPRTPGYRPQPQDNPLGAWYWRTEVKGADSGPLAGRTVALKDNICLAGVPMMNGSSVLEGYVPDIDATVVSRILDAGGTIAGKAVCEHLCASGGSHSSDTGPVHNPYDLSRTSGGSSSGSGALVAAGQVDMALGGDQGGSIRIPSSWCGICGLKPTHGLVPYTGIFPIDITIDHTGPMARSVADVALLLEVIAGPDGLDPRQQAGLQAQAYQQALSGEIRGLRVGLVQEGFGWDGLSEADVEDCVTESAQALAGLGAEVASVSIPWHRDGRHILNAILMEGATALVAQGNSMGTNWKGYYTTSLLDAYARGQRTRADDLSESVKLIVLLGGYMQEHYHGRYYAKAQNLARSLTAAYDAALQECDLLAMPTVPLKATRIPAPDASREELVARSMEMAPNTAPFDVSGHPAISVPCGMSDGLPIGMMLIGRTGDDATVLRAADAFQRQVYMPPSPPPVNAEC
ncbi:MAG: amidase [Desulfurellaceae bacterium]|nr:amidase [Desulfurellaceae bacterium]